MYSIPADFWNANSSRPSNDRHRPSAHSTLLATSTCAWIWGSPARDVRWVKAPATNPSVSTWNVPPRPVREKAAWSSRKTSAARTALSWAARTSAAVSASPKAPTSDTLFGGEKDRAKPVTTVRFESCRYGKPSGTPETGWQPSSNRRAS